MTTKRKKAAKAMTIKSKYLFLSILAKRVFGVSLDILFSPLKTIGKIGFTHNSIKSRRLRSNFYRSKKPRAGSLWNALPWLHYVFQVEKV
jgi:hypothetical protein